MNKIQHAFDRAAETYDQHCHVQLHTGKKLGAMIKSHHGQADRILDLGCGTGLTTQLFANQYQYQSFHAIDISSALLTKAKNKLQHSRIQIHQQDFDNLPFTPLEFNIIYSNMAVQWSHNLSALLQKIHFQLHKNGTLGMSIPLEGTFHELQSQCASNHFMKKETVTDYLVKNAYEILTVETETLTLNFPDTLHALKSIKQIGANHVTHRLHKGLRTFRYFKNINMQQLTFVIGYFVARKK